MTRVDQMVLQRLDKRLQLVGILTIVLMASMGRDLVAQEATLKARSESELAAVIELGEALVAETTKHPLSRNYVGNSLNCTSCHLDRGRHSTAGTFLGTATAYPAWSPREKRVVTLEDRVLNCFMRSCNGIRPPLGSEVSVAITTYITSLSQGQPMRMNSQRPVGPGALKRLGITSQQADIPRGKVLYAERCAGCHQEDGRGDEENPPVWGERSYNDGAGLSSVENLAAWLKVAMPLDEADLTEKEAIDIAAYVNSNPRPRFELEKHLPVKERLGEYNGAGGK